MFQGRKRNTNPNFLVRISSAGVGVFHAKGCGVAKKFGMSFETQGNQTFSGGKSRDFRRDILEVPEKFEKIMFVFNFWPLRLIWRVPNPPGANPLVAERAFSTGDYWGRTGVARCAEEMTGICRDFQWVADPLLHKTAKTSKGPFQLPGG